MFTGISFVNGTSEEVDLFGQVFGSCNFENYKVINSDITKVEFSNSKLINCEFIKTIFKSSNLNCISVWETKLGKSEKWIEITGESNFKKTLKEMNFILTNQDSSGNFENK